jgi:hypothetical protein
MHRKLVSIVGTAALLTSLLTSLTTGLMTGLVATGPAAHATVGAAGLNEVESQAHAGGSDWVEIVNVSGGPLSIGGWKIRDLAGNSVTVPAATALHPAGHYVFDVGSVLSSDDVVVLTDSTGTDVDWFHWFSHAAGTWSRCVEGTGSFLDSAPSKGSANPCRGPDIMASVSSAEPISANGWYGEPVTVTYTCKAGYAPISVCSLPQTLYSTGADQDVVGSVFDTSGASDKVLVTGINIDRLKPTFKLLGVRKGKTYATKQSPKIKASDLHSGLAKTEVTQKATYFFGGVKWKVIARVWDQAGNTAGRKLTYFVKTPQG